MQHDIITYLHVCTIVFYGYYIYNIMLSGASGVGKQDLIMKLVRDHTDYAMPLPGNISAATVHYY